MTASSLAIGTATKRVAASTASAGSVEIDCLRGPASAGDPAQAEEQRDRRQHGQQDSSHRHVGDGEVGAENPGRRQSDGVTERRASEELTPGPRKAEKRQEPAAEDEHQHVRQQELEDPRRHGALILETNSVWRPARTCVRNLTCRRLGSAKYETTTVASSRFSVCTAGRK